MDEVDTDKYRFYILRTSKYDIIYIKFYTIEFNGNSIYSQYLILDI